MGVQINGDTGNISATKADYSGNVTIGGTLTYEDVTNIDSVGLITAREGIEIGASPGVGASISVDGNAIFSGITTATTLRAPTGIVTSLIANTARATTGIVTTLTATTGIVTTFVTNTAKVGAAVTISESGLEATGVGITVANINGGQIGGRRNVLNNGAMQVVQRGTSFTSVGSNASTYLMDRFKMYVQNSTARFTVTQDSDSPDEFGGSMKIECTTTDTSLASTDEVYIEQRIEGQDLQHFAKGTSSARQYTLSFYAKTNKTGTYIVNLLSRDNTTGTVSAAYTVSDTNWNRYVVTFPADTNSNRKDTNDNQEALRVLWWFLAGSAVDSGTLQTTWANSSDTGRATGQLNFADSTSNYFYLTGCQLESGPQVTAYEHRSFGEEFQRCMRYYEKQSVSDGNGGYATVAHGYRATSTRVVIEPVFRVMKRAVNADFEFEGPMRLYYYAGSEQTIDAWTTINNAQFGIHGGYIVLDRSGGVGGSDGGTFRMEGSGDTSSYIAFASEM